MESFSVLSAFGKDVTCIVWGLMGLITNNVSTADCMVTTMSLRSSFCHKTDNDSTMLRIDTNAAIMKQTMLQR